MTVHSKPTKGPLIAFGCGGLNGAYYLGTASFIRDHFDLIESDVSFSGVSCGVFAAFVLFLELSLSQAFKYLSMLNTHFSSRKLGILFNDAQYGGRLWYDLTVSTCNKTDDVLKAQYRKFNSLYFGCSAISLDDRYLPTLKKVQPGSDKAFTSIYDLVHAMTVSTRTIPFYLSFGKIKHEFLCFDGGATQNFAISDHDAASRNVIQISAFPRNSLWNICGPNAADTICTETTFAVTDYFKIGPFEEQLRRYKIGYLSASKYCNVWSMIKKGLIWKNEFDPNDIADEEKWGQHLEQCMYENIQRLRDENHEIRSQSDKGSEQLLKKRKTTVCPMILSLIMICVSLCCLFV